MDDLGAFAAEVFKKPSKFTDGAFDLAGDVVSMDGAAKTFAKVIGRPVNYAQIDWAAFESRAGRELTIMNRYFEAAPSINPAVLRAAVPGASTFETYLCKAGWGQ